MELSNNNNNNVINHFAKKGNAASDTTTTSSVAELTAAAALAGLGAPNGDASSHSSEAVVVATSLVIPQRYTMSGRQRAVPFPLKVCMC